jgi:hypothetical protein
MGRVQEPGHSEWYTPPTKTSLLRDICTIVRILSGSPSSKFLILQENWDAGTADNVLHLKIWVRWECESVSKERRNCCGPYRSMGIAWPLSKRDDVRDCQYGLNDLSDIPRTTTHTALVTETDISLSRHMCKRIYGPWRGIGESGASCYNFYGFQPTSPILKNERVPKRSRVRFPGLSDFLSSSGSGTGSTQPL